MSSESSETRQGFRKGDVLSTLHFNVVLEVIVRRASLQTTGTIYNKETQLLAYAVDIDINVVSQSAVRDANIALEREAAKVGLKINEQKTKYMIAVRNDRTIRDMMGRSVANVSLEIQRRIQTANRLRYACHMIRRPDDLLQRAKPNGRRNQGRPKSRWADGVNSDSLALGVKTGRHRGIFFNRP
jgi:hypothetical protein